jgi:hypothetical protein
VTRVVRTDKPDPATNEEATALWRISVKDPDERKVGRAFSNAVIETALASIPGMYGVGGGPSAASPYGVYRPALIDAGLVPQHVHVDDRTIQIEPITPSGPVPVIPTEGPAAAPPDGPTTPGPLGRVVGARSGDKGGDANLGVFARTDVAWAWLVAVLTPDRLVELVPAAGRYPIDRYRLANIRALNFVIHGLLEEGVAASTRQDAQAKSLGEWLRARIVDIPDTLLDEL